MTAALRWLASIYAGGTPSKDVDDFWADGTVPWLNSGSVNDWEIAEPSTFITAAGLASSSARWIPANSVVMALAGQGKTKATAARLAIAATCNQSMAAIVPGPDLDYRYLHFVLNSKYEQIRNMAGGDLRDGLNLQHVGDILIPVLPVEEQRRIADFLDDQVSRIDAVIAAREAQSRALDEQILALTEELVWHGTGKGPYAASGIDPAPEAPIHWQRIRNRYVLRERVLLSETGDEELLTVSHLTGVSLRSDKSVSMFMAASLVGYKRVFCGDLVINTLWGWMGALGVSKVVGIVSPAYGVYHPIRRDVLPAYLDLQYRSKAYICQITRFSTGIWSSRLRIYPDAFLGLVTVVPPLEEQQEIVDTVGKASADDRSRIAALQQSILLLSEYKRSLITATVTGALDVTTTRPGIPA